MKSRILPTLLMLFCVNLCFAQSQELFKKYADKEGVTSVYLSKQMLDANPMLLISKGIIHDENLKKKITSLEVLVASWEAAPEMKPEFTELVSKKKYEEVMRTKTDSSKVSVYFLPKDESVIEILILIETTSNFTAIRMGGDFTPKELRSLTILNT